jgi:ketosteroid isomerase-like protein
MHGTVDTPGTMPAAFAQALEDGDLEGLASLYAEEAATRTPEGRIVRGLADIREVLRGLLARQARFDGKVRWSVAVGDTALVIVDWTRQETDPDGRRVLYSGVSTHVLRRGPGAGWRFLIMNPNGTVGTANPEPSEIAGGTAS